MTLLSKPSIAISECASCAVRRGGATLTTTYRCFQPGSLHMNCREHHFTELNQVDDPHLRRRIWKRSVALLLLEPKCWLIIALMAITTRGGKWWLTSNTTTAPVIADMICASVFGFGSYLGSVWLMKARLHFLIRRRLSDLGFHVCMSCGYDLRGTPSGRCEECGSPLMDDAGATGKS